MTAERGRNILSALASVWCSHECLMAWRLAGWLTVARESWQRAEADLARVYGRPSPVIDAFIGSEDYVFRSDRSGESEMVFYELQSTIEESILRRFQWDEAVAHCGLYTVEMLRLRRPRAPDMLKMARNQLEATNDDFYCVRGVERLRQMVTDLHEGLVQLAEQPKSGATERFALADRYAPVVKAMHDALRSAIR